MQKMKYRRPANLKLRYSPRKNDWTISLNGKIVDRCKEYSGCEAFIKGWRESENKHNQRVKQFNSGEITLDEFFHFQQVDRVIETDAAA